MERHKLAAAAACAVVLAVIALIIGTSGSGTSSQATGTAAAAAPSSDAGAEPPSGIDSSTASSDDNGDSACTSHSCIVQTAQASMVGMTAKDGSVVTKATCYSTNVKSNPGDTYTVSCDVTYTDGSVWNGLVTLLMDSNQVSWQTPTRR